MSDAPYGYELIIDLHECDPTLMTKDGVTTFCAELCDLIKMNREDIHIWASAEKEWLVTPPHLYGVSAVQFITTSDLVIHTLPKLLRAYINLFSCKWFDPMAAQKFVQDYFTGKVINSHFMRRM